MFSKTGDFMVPGFRGAGVLREEIAEQIFAESRRSRREIDAGELAALRALARVEEQERAVVAPGDRVRERVRKKAHRASGTASDWDEADVGEGLRANRENRDPLAVRRPDRIRRRHGVGQRARRQHTVLLRRQIQHVQRVAIAQIRDRFAVR
jgi:hypothetical protein